MEHTIQQVARAAGTTSRTLRHYDDIGILPPTRIGGNGFRYYDERALVRLQRILLLRELGLGLTEIGRVLAAQDADRLPTERAEAAETRILTDHLALLHDERTRLEARIAAVEHTIAALAAEGTHHTKETLMTDRMFDGFDHAEHREEVERRWGGEAYRRSDTWWRGLNDTERGDWKSRSDALVAAWREAAEAGVDPESPRAQELSARHVAWLSGIPGTPAGDGGDLRGYVLGLAEMYVADERFAANYGGAEGAGFVRDALQAYVARELS
ncbi:MerR family transcriptional regulator [Leucobacter sp. CSA2]|uniref:MerR family transcriptional regulator n=1 Tax=Leucobacter edaphi TaxID=2796472 RepID=A0A934UWW7_9MICO|nr:MerR family transcriptional regulator [Leucobacter edaphi]MBK0422119.1 MerR family transcriptional regulator [Leucobacter edaphi]